MLILEDLYVGDIRPNERSFKRNSQYAKALDEVVKAGDALTDGLSEEQKALFEGNHWLYMELKDDASLQTEALHLWVHCLNQLIDMGRCADADRVEYHRIVADADKHHPSFKMLLKESSNLATRIKLFPLLLLGLRTYCRIYVALAKPLLP